MDEATRLFLSARINMFRLLTTEENGKRKPLDPETYAGFKESLRSFSLGQGSLGYEIPVSMLKAIGLDVDEWKALGDTRSTDDIIYLSDYYHATEMETVLTHLINQDNLAINALQQGLDIVEKNQTMQRA